ncbi:hypothetical protein Sango_0405200 [Sesamum angolense]|uniref:Uncharacterized protein n=1 Tax=Sesamum angolense TaxID=2727404 RepID=A0AAE2C3Z6_9LAMI|nr:hypothetical protein Sango_0405200 [Sesamum angolense]
MFDFAVLTARPETSLNSWRHSIIMRIDGRSPRENNIRSSAKRRWVIFSFSHFGWKLKSELVVLLLIRREKYSIQRRNRAGDIGSPCLRPFFPGKSPCRESFNATEKMVVETHSIIQEMKSGVKPYPWSTRVRNVHETESNAFLRAVMDFFRCGRMLRQLNHTIIALVPKSEHSPLVADYRLISCCNVIYKVITKIIAYRISPALEQLIDSS